MADVGSWLDGNDGTGTELLAPWYSATIVNIQAEVVADRMRIQRLRQL